MRPEWSLNQRIVARTHPRQIPPCSAPQSDSHGGGNRCYPLKLSADYRKLAGEQGQARAHAAQDHGGPTSAFPPETEPLLPRSPSNGAELVAAWRIHPANCSVWEGSRAHPSRSLPLPRPSTSPAWHFMVLPSGCRVRVTAQLLKHMLGQVPNRDLKGGPFRLALELKSIVVPWCTLMNATRCLQ